MPFKYNPFSDEMDYYADTLPTIKLTDLTDGYIPYHVSDAAGLDDSPLFTDGTNIGIGRIFSDDLLGLYGTSAPNGKISFRMTNLEKTGFTQHVIVAGSGSSYSYLFGESWVTVGHWSAATHVIETNVSNGIALCTTHASGKISFWTAGDNERAVIDSSGDMWILGGSIVVAQSEYVNFGANQGVTGYGLRDKSGQIECKDSGGTWREVKGIAVGGYYFNSTGADPNTELGYGTWTQVAQGQFLIGAT